MKRSLKYLVVLLACLAGTVPVRASKVESGAWIETLVYGKHDLVPVVSFDVSAAPYSADRYGREDSTQAFADALADAAREGGTVYAPAGRYRIGGTLSIPAGVTLSGDFKRPTEKDARVLGTVLMAFAGRGSEEGSPFITVDQGGVRDLSIIYPEQLAQSPAPYPTCIHLKGNSAVKNLNLVNPYKGILTGSFSTVMNVYGSPLKTGVTMLHAAAVPRCNGISLSPRYWVESGFPGAPSMRQLQEALAKTQACGIQLNRQDAGIFIDIAIDHYPTAVKFMPPHGWTYWHNLRITNAEVGIHFTGGSNHRVNFTGSSISARRYGVLMQMDKTGWEPDWIRHSKSKKAFGTQHDHAELRMFGCHFGGTGTNLFLDGSFSQTADLQECTFASWGSGPDDYAIDVAGGRLDLFDSKLQHADRHVRFKGRADSLTVVGNQFRGAPDLEIPGGDGARIDHSTQPNTGGSLPALQPVPETPPARTGPDSLYVVNAPSDGVGEAGTALQRALDKAGADGGGTVYLRQGRYRVSRHLKIPAGVELRGVNDFMPRGRQVRTMLIADLPDDRGRPENPPFISLDSSPKLGGSGVAGLAIWYLHQDYRDIQPFPWTIRGLGPECWVRRVYLGNCYNAVDFATHDSDRHVLSRVNGSALNIAFMVGNTKTIGWIDNCHIRPQDWALASNRGLTLEFPGENKPTTKDIFRGTELSLIPNLRGSGTITVGSGANEQITGYFTNGSSRTFDFIDHDGGGGGNATILIGGSEAAWGSWVKALGDKGVTFVNFSFNPMSRLPYVKPEDIPVGQLPKGLVMRVDPTVGARSPIHFLISKFYGRKEVELGFDLRGGRVLFKQVNQVHAYGGPAVKLNGGQFEERNTKIGATEDETE